MPAMERVRLEVLETRRNSEKPKPKARIPPRKRLPSTRRSSPVSWKRKIFSDVDKWRPESKGGESGRPWPWCACQGATEQPCALTSTCCGLEEKDGRCWRTPCRQPETGGEAVMGARGPWASESQRAHGEHSGGLLSLGAVEKTCGSTCSSSVY